MQDRDHQTGNPVGKNTGSLSADHFALLRRAVEAGLIRDEDAAEILRTSDGDGASIYEAILNHGPGQECADLSGLLRGRSRDEETVTLTTETVPQGDGTGLPPLPGLPSRYQVVRLLGQGGMGQVYLAHDNELRRDVAIKVLSSGRFRSVLGEMMRREQEVLALLDDPGIVSVFHSGSLDDGSPFFVMQLVDGVNLDAFVNHKRLNVRQTVAVVAKVADSLSRAHLLNIIHRDLKPQNIRVTSTGQPVLLDFGLAKPASFERVFGPEASEFSYQTALAGHIVGTPAYMSPEQAAGKELDASSDVFSLGIVLYELLGRQKPHNLTGLSFEEQAEFWRRQPPPLLRKIAPDVPADLAAIVHRCLQPAKQDRYADASELADDLDRFVTNRAVNAYGHRRPIYRLRRLVGRNRLVTMAALISITLLFAALGSWMLYWRNSVERRADVALQAERDRMAKRQAEQEDTLQQRSATEAARRHLESQQFQLAMRELDRVPPSRRGWEHSRMKLEARQSPRVDVHSVHDWGIFDSLLTPNGETIVTSGQDGLVIAWDVRSARHRVLRHGVWSEDHLLWYAFWHSGDKVPASQEQFEVFTKLAYFRERLIGVSWLRDPQAAIDDDNLSMDIFSGRVVSWDLEAATEEIVFSHSRPFVALAANGEQLLLGDVDGTLLLGKLGEPLGVATADLPKVAVIDICSLGEGGWAVAYENGSIALLNAAATEVLDTWKTREQIWDLAADNEGGRVAVASASRKIALLSASESGWAPTVASVDLPLSLKGLPPAAHCVQFDATGMQLFAGDHLGRVSGWDLETGDLKFTFKDQHVGRAKATVLANFHQACRRTVTGIESTPGNAELWTVGRDSTVKRWSDHQDDGITELQLSAAAQFAFDPGHPDLIWAATHDELLLVHSRDGTRLTSHSHPGGSPLWMAVASEADMVATCVDNSIHLWTHDNWRITSMGKPISHDKPLRTVALRHDGEVVAAYDSDDNVVTWDTTTGRKLQTQNMLSKSEEASSVTGLVQFNCDGTKLAACCPGQMVAILDAESLVVQDRPYLVNGGHATALMWDPVKPGIIWVGDDNGGIGVNEQQTWLERTQDDNVQTIALTHTSIGNRIARANQSGTIVIYDLQWLGEADRFQSRHSVATEARVIGTQFDPTGKRLAVLHDDGILQILEVERFSEQRDLRLVPPATRWHKEVYPFAEPIAADATTGLGGVRMKLDASARPVVLFHTRHDNDDESQSYVLYLARARHGKLWREEVVALPSLNARIGTHFRESISLATRGDRFLLTYRRPRTDINSLVGELVVCSGDGSEISARHTLHEPMNYGFDAKSFIDRDGNGIVTHYSFDGYYLGLFRQKPRSWEQSWIGRQGDGRNGQVCIDNQGRVHAAYLMNRFNGDPTIVFYVRADVNSEEDHPLRETGQIRESIDTHPLGQVYSIATSATGRPHVLYSRVFSNNRPTELVLAVRDDKSWQRDIVATGNHIFPTQLQIQDNGTVQFAYFDEAQNAIMLATRAGGKWTAQQAIALPRLAPTERYGRLTLLRDAQGGNVVTVVRYGPKSASVLVFYEAASESSMKQQASAASVAFYGK